MKIILSKMCTRAAQILHSKIDQSVNWVRRYGKGSIETRYVRKKPDYFIAYVSSHSGCRMGCKFCYLTQQKQTSMDHVDIEGYTQQFQTVLEHYDSMTYAGGDKAKRVNVNFMARGEPFANRHLVKQYPALYWSLEELAKVRSLNMKMNISTIMPYTMAERRLIDVFGYLPAHVYYSLYSLDTQFRDEWMPRAMPVDLALKKLKEYEETANIDTPVTFHWAYIKGHNDSIDGAKNIANMLRDYRFRAKFNLVRFNPHPNLAAKGIEEPDEKHLEELFGIISGALGHNRSYMVPRVGKDVSASCGMFIDQ